MAGFFGQRGVAFPIVAQGGRDRELKHHQRPWVFISGVMVSPPKAPYCQTLA
jgi:hypothetical protein